MDKSYLSLFATIAQTAEILAEKVMEYDEEKNDMEGRRAAQIMREDYANLYDKIRDNENVQLNKSEFSKLLIASIIVSKNLETQIEQLQKTYNSYNVTIIPKLARINDETKSDEEAETLANELFSEINI